MKSGVYVHIPFCASKCHYCDFLSFADCSNYLKKDYVTAICKEIEFASEEFPNLSIDTIYIGGGTPTVLPPYWINGILSTIRQNFNVLPKAEITVEANPCTTSPNITRLKLGYVNRISLGLQSTCNKKLSLLNRIHTMEDFLKNFHSARQLRFNNINIDLMFALPNQDINEWRETLETVINLSPEHISVYSLTPAEGTPLYDDIKSGRIVLPDDSIDRDMYHLARQMLNQAGYNQYELSNFAKPNYESKHNINCWKRKPYIGFGIGAHSFMNSCRWNNTKVLKRYLDVFLNPSYNTANEAKTLNEIREETQKISQDEAMAETMILGLRLTQGVCIQDFKEIFDVSPTEKYNLDTLVKNGLLIINDEYISLTARGMDLANQVFMTF